MSFLHVLTCLRRALISSYLWERGTGDHFTLTFGFVKLLSLMNFLLSTEGYFLPPQQFRFSLLKDLFSSFRNLSGFEDLLLLVFVMQSAASADSMSEVLAVPSPLPVVSADPHSRWFIVLCVMSLAKLIFALSW